MHPRAGDVIRQVRRCNLPPGLYTKGRRLEGDIAEALLDGTGECFLTVSLLDDVDETITIGGHFNAIEP